MTEQPLKIKLLKADYDAAIVSDTESVEVWLARSPGLEVTNTIYSLLDYPGILAPDELQYPSGTVIYPHTKLPRYRLYYWFRIPPVYETHRVANGLAHALRDEHQLTVRVVHDRDPEDPYSNSIVLKA